MTYPLITLVLTLISASAMQDKPEPIAKKDLPKLAHCVICSAHGSGEGEEKPAAGVMYKGKAYYFCNTKEVATFSKTPDFYLPLELPMSMPKFDLTDTGGKLWNAEAFKGKLVLIDYWATWCKPCLELKPKLDLIRNQYKSQNFEILSVSTDEKKDAFDKFFAKKKWDNPVALDTKTTWSSFKIVAIPALFLVKDGQVVAQFRGVIDTKAVQEAVKANLP